MLHLSIALQGLWGRSYEKVSVFCGINSSKKACVSKSQMKAMVITSCCIKGTIHSEFIPQGQTVNQAYYVEILKQLCEAVHRKRPEGWIPHFDDAPAYKLLSVKQFLAQKLITEMEHSPFSPDLALSAFWLFLKRKYALKG
jgi:hypothetical protein